MLSDGPKEVAITGDICEIYLAKSFEVHSSVDAKFEERWSREIIDTGDRRSLKSHRQG